MVVALNRVRLLSGFKMVNMFFLALAQNASFTLVSRARNSKSIPYHIVGATLSNGIWLLVFRQLTVSVSDWKVGIGYLLGSVFGSVAMHWFLMAKVEIKPTAAEGEERENE
jgi:hypothetical protein